MSSMQSVEIPTDRVAVVRAHIPDGIEHYFMERSGFTFLNLRTGDHELVCRLVETAQRP